MIGYIDCNNIETTIKTLSYITGLKECDINNFINDNKYRVRVEGISYNYDNFNIDDFYAYFSTNIEVIKRNIREKYLGITFYHLTSTLTELKRPLSLMNLKDVLLGENQITSYLKKYGFKFTNGSNGIKIIYNEVPVELKKGTMLKRRLGWDYCINGFLINDQINENMNTEHITKCPEIISTLAGFSKDDTIVKEWERNSYSYVLKCIADISQIGLSSYDINIEEENFFSMKEQWLLKSLEYILLETTGYRDIDNNPIVYLKEEVILDDSRIIDYYKLS